jgi:hypothetical protein
MPYIGKSPQHGNYSKIDDISSGFDGSEATHAIASNSVAITPVRPEALIISMNGVIQEPVTDYTVSGTNITFTTAPVSTDSFFGVAMGEQLAIGTPSDATVTSAKLSGNLVTPGTLDVNGQELILDADADTSITADTDDQVDIKVGGTDVATLTNSSLVLKGTTPTLTIGDAGAEDTKIVFDGNAQDFHIGLDDSSDSLTIGLGSTLGTTAHIISDASGRVTKPLQPLFLVRSAGATNVTGGGTQYTVAATNEIYDIGSNWSTNTFTAPVTSSMDNASFGVVTSNYTSGYWHFFGNIGAMRDNNNAFLINGSIVADMDASDTAVWKLQVNSGSDVADIGASDTNLFGALLA